MDVDTPGADALLSTLVTSRPDTPVLAWTNAPAAVAEHVTRVAGVRACAVVSRSALNAEIHDAINRLLLPS
jgi:hypothetical protein